MIEIRPANDGSPWSEHLNDLLPWRYTRGNAGAYFMMLNALVSDLVDQLVYDTTYWRHTKHPNSPIDAPGVIGPECTIPRYSGESISQYTQRVEAKWQQWETLGSEESLLREMAYAGFNDVYIEHDVPGDIRNPASPGYRSQFIIVINISSPSPGTESRLVTDEQLATIRLLVARAKPVQYVCRDIVIVYDPTTTGIAYDGTEDWEDLPGTDEYVDEVVLLAAGYVYERHSPIN